MGENAVLALEDGLVLSPGTAIVRVGVRPVWAGQVAVLCDTELPIADLFVRQAGNDDLRVGVMLTRNDVVVHGGAVIQSFILADR